MNERPKIQIHSSNYIEVMSKIAFCLHDIGFSISTYRISGNELAVSFSISGTAAEAQEKTHAFMHAFFASEQ